MSLKLFTAIKNERFSLIGFLVGVAPLWVYFFNFPLTPKRDWDYFNSLALLFHGYIGNGKLPMLDSWICGGIDILANPQNWLFSPFIILSVLFPPYIGNVLGLFVSAAIGFCGCLKLFRGKDKLETIFISTIFLLSPFFFLHFAEGHIPYRTFYFLPLVMFLGRRLQNNFDLWVLAGLLAWMFLDGGLYPFYYSLILLLFNLNWRRLWNLMWIKASKTDLMMVSGAFFLLIPKVLPVLFIHQGRIPEHESSTYSLPNILQAFYSIHQTNFMTLEGQVYYFHEYGHYLGLGITLLFFLSLWSVRKNLKIFFQLLFFLWIALGIGGAFNPWTLFKLIPFLNHLHVQSRFLVIVFLLMLYLVSQFEFKFKKVFLSLAILELMYCGFYTSHAGFTNSMNSRDVILKPATRPTKLYENYIAKPEVYSSENISYHCYEPAKPKALQSSLALFSPTAPSDMTAIFSPNEMKLSSSLPIKEVFAVNYNWNGGWDCEGCEAINNQGLIEIHPNGNSEIKLSYNPVYGQLSFVIYLIGLSLFLVAGRRSWRGI